LTGPIGVLLTGGKKKKKGTAHATPVASPKTTRQARKCVLTKGKGRGQSQPLEHEEKFLGEKKLRRSFPSGSSQKCAMKEPMQIKDRGKRKRKLNGTTMRREKRGIKLHCDQYRGQSQGNPSSFRGEKTVTKVHDLCRRKKKSSKKERTAEPANYNPEKNSTIGTGGAQTVRARGKKD